MTVTEDIYIPKYLETDSVAPGPCGNLRVVRRQRSKRNEARAFPWWFS
jgi:hypothetical protein